MVEKQHFSHFKVIRALQMQPPMPLFLVQYFLTKVISELQLYPLRTEKRYSSIFNKQQPPEIGASCLAPDKATAVKPQLKPQRESG